MRTTRRMDVMIARPPAELRWINPTFHFELKVPGLLIHLEVQRFHHRFGAAREFHGVIAVGQFQRFAVAAIDLRVKREVGCESLGRRWIDPLLGVANQERRGGRLIVLVAHAERDGVCG
jgi:hypothetical protein